MDKEKTAKTEEIKEVPKLKGRYISTIGRRKTAIARVRVYKKGSGIFLVNNFEGEDYFIARDLKLAKQALKLTGHLRDFDISIVCRGGGKIAQAEAVRHGLSRALVEFDAELKPSLKAKGWLKRDARKKERKKPGLKKARKAPQWSKR